jgi:hypothetical protein
MGKDCFNAFGLISRKLKTMKPVRDLLRREP